MNNFSKRISKILLFVLSIVIICNLIACNNNSTSGNNISKVEIVTLPNKISYAVNEEFNSAGGKLKVTYNDDTEKELGFLDEGVLVLGADTKSAGEKTVSVVYHGRIATFKINVTDSEAPQELTVLSIAMNTNPLKINYKVGEMFRSNRGSILVTYSDNSTKVVYLSDENIILTGADTSTIGTKTVTVSYFEKVTTFSITVSNEGGGQVEKQVRQIRVNTLPTVTEYFIDDTFDPSGAIVTVTYFDGTEEDIDILSEGVTVSSPNMSSVAQRSVTVTYQGNSTTFNIRVVRVGAVVTFNNNYAEGGTFEVRVAQNRAVDEPLAPSRTGFSFYKWYEDAACTIEYVFSSDKVLTSNMTLYAQWKQDGATYFDFVYDLNYYGVKLQLYPQIVKSGEKARVITGFTPSRVEHSFDGWFSNANGTTSFDSNANINANTTIYAKWTKTKVGSSEYVFEAEHTDLTGKTGNGASGTATGPGLIVDDNNGALGASNGMFISYLYKDGLTLDFHIAASEADSNATLKVRISAELANINITSGLWQVLVNGVEQSYASISVVNGAAFSDQIIINGITLNAGHNYIALKTNNAINPVGSGTYDGTAPIVDCIKITSTAVLIWDGTKNLPANI